MNQAVYVLRAMLGEEAIVPRGDGALGLADVVSCDAVAFEAALDAGKSDEALALYRGDLLEGFFISGAPEFERWLDGERTRLRHRAAEGAWALAEAKAGAGAAVEAARWARKASDLLPADEAVALGGDDSRSAGSRRQRWAWWRSRRALGCGCPTGRRHRGRSSASRSSSHRASRWRMPSGARRSPSRPMDCISRISVGDRKATSCFSVPWTGSKRSRFRTPMERTCRSSLRMAGGWAS